jgi:hypothetical protein
LTPMTMSLLRLRRRLRPRLRKRRGRFLTNLSRSTLARWLKEDSRSSTPRRKRMSPDLPLLADPSPEAKSPELRNSERIDRELLLTMRLLVWTFLSIERESHSEASPDKRTILSTG